MLKDVISKIQGILDLAGAAGSKGIGTSSAGRIKINKAMVMKSMSGQKGFTLLEVMIAVFLLTVAIMGTAAVTTSVIKGNFSSQTSTTATTLAKDKMEELKAAPYSTLSNAGSPDYATANGTIQASASGSYYTRTWGVTGTNPRNITVTVTWPVNRTVELRTIRAKD